MLVYIVLRNGKVDEVFSNLPAAEAHKKNLVALWAIAEILEREVKEL